MSGGLGREMRRATRTRTSDAMFFSVSREDLPEMGWLLERSEDGAAFAWRGDDPPTVGTILYVQLEATRHERTPRTAVVRRCSRAHDDLFVIAAELVDLHPFPPAAIAKEIPKRAHVRVVSEPFAGARLAA